MSVARTTEISATSTKSFEDAIKLGVGRAVKTLRNVRQAWVKDQEVVVENDKITAYKVNMKITFVLDDN
ncbi:MAG TPA: dodecin family protein [Kiloniellales bacterium]|nr:dodecin family protein [Kiloniellales bacterium]